MKRTTAIDRAERMASLASRMKRVAWFGTFSGQAAELGIAYFRSCRSGDPDTGSILIFTRDIGMHSSGWWKNPDYERCWHLSVSFVDPETGERAPRSRDVTREWIDLFFDGWQRLIWAEPPYSPDGKRADVWHYRVFVDESWTVPLLPRGEVYSRELTEAGWKSWSEVCADEEAQAAASVEA